MLHCIVQLDSYDQYRLGLVTSLTSRVGDGRVARWCWVNFQCQSVLLIWITVGQGPAVLAVGTMGFFLYIFPSSIISVFFLLLSGRRPNIRLKYCLKGQPTNSYRLECVECAIFPESQHVVVVSSRLVTTCSRVAQQYCNHGRTHPAPCICPRRIAVVPIIWHFFREYTLCIGVGRFRILQRGRFRILRGPGGGGQNSQQAHDVVTTSHRRHFDVMCPLCFYYIGAK